MGAQLRNRLSGSFKVPPTDLVMVVGVGISGPFSEKLNMPLVLTRVPCLRLQSKTLWTTESLVL